MIILHLFLKIGITIVDDNQWEPDEEFFVKLTLIPGEDSENVKLGKTCIMEITILNDDGKILQNDITNFKFILRYMLRSTYSISNFI